MVKHISMDKEFILYLYMNNQDKSMSTTFGQLGTFANSNISFVASTFTFEEFSVAYELSLVEGGTYRRKQLYNQIFEKDKEKKRKVIELILKVKGKTIKDNVKIPTNVDIALSNIDLVIQEVLNKPSVNVYA